MQDEADDFTYYSEGELLNFFSEAAGVEDITNALAGATEEIVGVLAGSGEARKGIHLIAHSPLPISTEQRDRWALPSSLEQIEEAVGRRTMKAPRFCGESEVPIVASKAGAYVIPTETLYVEGAKASDVHWARNKFGAEIVDEGLQGKLLLRAPADSADSIRAAFAIARNLYQRNSVRAAHPNFLRTYPKLNVLPGQSGVQWNYNNQGGPGLVGADVHAHAAWTITKGTSEVAVAILDEGVDTQHPDLKPAVIAEKDFVDDNPHAYPDGNDAHGTACAGIVSSRSTSWPGLASGVSLIAVRIAKDDGSGRWVIDDYEAAEAIDWAWENGASVLSNSWCGGPLVDGIRLAFQRARTRGRSGKGAVVIVAAGNSQTPVGFPGNLRGVLTVGASNQWDEPKTRTSKDGENWWGSNYGEAVRLLAPGVRIPTTDIQGSRGYGNQNYTFGFNGTSAATPHVAAVAALLLSVAPELPEKKIREILVGTAERVPGQRGLSGTYGRGRLNAYAALRAARRA